MYYQFPTSNPPPFEKSSGEGIWNSNSGATQKRQKWSNGIDGSRASKQKKQQQQFVMYAPAPSQVVYAPYISNVPGHGPLYFHPQQGSNKSHPPSPPSKTGKQGVAAVAEQARTKHLHQQLLPLVLNLIGFKNEEFKSYPDLAAKIISTFKSKDNSELSLMLESRDLFEARFEEAIAGIKADEARLKASQRKSASIAGSYEAKKSLLEDKIKQESDKDAKEKPKTVVVVKHNMDAIASLKEEIEHLKTQRDSLTRNFDDFKKESEAREKRQSLIIEDFKRKSLETAEVEDLSEKLAYVKQREEELKAMKANLEQQYKKKFEDLSEKLAYVKAQEEKIKTQRANLEQQFKKTKAESKTAKEEMERLQKLDADLAAERYALDEKLMTLKKMEERLEKRQSYQEQCAEVQGSPSKSKKTTEEKVPVSPKSPKRSNKRLRR